MSASAINVAQLATRFVEDPTFFKQSLSPLERIALRLAYTRETNRFSYAGAQWDEWVRQKAGAPSSATAAA